MLSDWLVTKTNRAAASIARTLCGKSVSPVGLGCMGMSEFYGATDDNVSLKALRRAYELGYRHFDTADMYGFGHNEKLLGLFVKTLGCDRDKIVLASKVGIVRDQNNKYKLSVDGSRQYIKTACEQSLRRFSTDYIDLYYLHRRDPTRPIEETMEALVELLREGKIRAIGLSEVSVGTLEIAHKIHPITALQNEYSLWSRDVEDELLPACQRLNIALVAFSPMGRGFLSGSVTKDCLQSADPEMDFRTKLPRFSEENIDANLRLVARLRDLADTLGVTAAQLALAWILSKGNNIYVIPGTKRLTYLAENFASQRIHLEPAIVQQLEGIFTKEAVQGGRYPQEILVRSKS